MRNRDGFWGKVVVPDDSDACWLWNGARHRDGYGQIQWQGKVCLAHRVSYEIATGSPPASSKCVCHTCDNPSCTNPRHLFIGTHQDNMRDKRVKGRLGCVTGVDHPRTRLTEDDVRAIRTAPRGWGKTKLLVEKYGLTRAAILSIQNGTNWPHVT